MKNLGGGNCFMKRCGTNLVSPEIPFSLKKRRKKSDTDIHPTKCFATNSVLSDLSFALDETPGML